jgi:polyisoprenoid-binding protein YceI
MSLNPLLRTAPIVVVLAAAAMSAGPAAQARPPIGIDTARVTIAGSSNIHEYTASTTTVRVTRVKVGSAIPVDALWNEVVKPGALEGFEIAIPAASLSSPKAGLDKNMHKALKVEQFPDITFRLTRLENATSGAVTAIGVLRIAGVDREVALDLKTARKGGAFVVTGSLPLLMTDYGIKPPTAMLGMLTTDPKVTVSFETVLAVPLT